MPKITIDIDEDLYSMLKTHALEEDCSVSRIARKIFRDFTKQLPKAIQPIDSKPKGVIFNTQQQAPQRLPAFLEKKAKEQSND